VVFAAHPRASVLECGVIRFFAGGRRLLSENPWNDLLAQMADMERQSRPRQAQRPSGRLRPRPTGVNLRPAEGVSFPPAPTLERPSGRTHLPAGITHQPSCRRPAARQVADRDEPGRTRAPTTPKRQHGAPVKRFALGPRTALQVTGDAAGPHPATRFAGAEPVAHPHKHNPDDTVTQRACTDKQACTRGPPALVPVVPSERPTRLTRDDRFHGKQQRVGRSASSVRTAQL
jgi:hypothetical protein